jgi:hypothetical protein
MFRIFGKMYEAKLDDEYVFVPEVYDHFKLEYKSSDMLYTSFINSKQLGLLTAITKENELFYGKEIHCDYYKIVDEKQWFLAKIKYGI